MLTVLEIIKKTTDFFSGRGVENPRLNAELIIGHALGLGRMQLYLQFERPLLEPELEKIRPLVRRRGQREPLQYVLGQSEFFGLKLKTDRRALIPRPETEQLVELVISRLTAENPPRRILDLGTGTGAIALAMAKQYPDAAITAVDRSPDALALSAENAELTGLAGRVAWLESDWFSALPSDARFEVIIANPPYLSADDTAQTEPEVRDHEPAAALTAGGNDGLADLRRIILGSPAHLTPGGLLALETGIAQHFALVPLMQEAGMIDAESLHDLTGRERFVVARRPVET